MQPAQYWKPGEEKPRAGEDKSMPARKSKDHHPLNSSDASGGRSHRTSTDGAMRHGKTGAGDSTRRRHSGGGSDPNKTGKKPKKGGKYSSSGNVEESPASSGGQPAVAAGPSQGLLAMKFMQRKAKIDEVQQKQQERREALQREFTSSYSKRLKAGKANVQDRLVCQLDELNPALVVVGRRSFGGFNPVAEAAYEACIKDIAAGERLVGSRRRGDDDGGISDTEMAERLGRHVRHARR